MNAREKAEGDRYHPNTSLAFVGDGTVEIRTKGKENPERFTFDRIFSDPDTPQASIYSEAAYEAVVNLIEGYNSTIFAYGQTGSGKSFTMFGPNLQDPNNWGIIPRSVAHLFDYIETEADPNVEFTIKASFAEIYLEKVKDLLNPRGAASGASLKVREDPSRGVWVEGLTEHSVQSANEIFELLALGEKCRATSATAMNAVSSRSHSVFMITLVQKSADGSTKSGVMNLCDLAGSEKVQKCLAPDTGVALASGEVVRAAKVTEGVRVLGADGAPRTVVATCSGTAPMYRVAVRGEEELGDAVFECNQAHRLVLRVGSADGPLQVVEAADAAELEAPLFAVRRAVPVWPTETDFAAIVAHSAGSDEVSVELAAADVGAWLVGGDLRYPTTTPHLAAALGCVVGAETGDAHRLVSPSLLTTAYSLRLQVLAGAAGPAKAVAGPTTIVAPSRETAASLVRLARSLGLWTTARQRPGDGDHWCLVLPPCPTAEQVVPLDVAESRIGLFVGFTLSADPDVDTDTDLNPFASSSHFLLPDFTVTHNTEAQGMRLQEAQKINWSLSALGHCINSLTTRKKGEHIPYRDSKLTHILKESLGGNAKTTLLIACSPHKFNLDETISTLRFGARAKMIENEVKINKQRSAAELEAIVDRLTAQLDALRAYVQLLEAALTERDPAFDFEALRAQSLQLAEANREKAKAAGGGAPSSAPAGSSSSSSSSVPLGSSPIVSPFGVGSGGDAAASLASEKEMEALRLQMADVTEDLAATREELDVTVAQLAEVEEELKLQKQRADDVELDSKRRVTEAQSAADKSRADAAEAVAAAEAAAEQVALATTEVAEATERATAAEADAEAAAAQVQAARAAQAAAEEAAAIATNKAAAAERAAAKAEERETAARQEMKAARESLETLQSAVAHGDTELRAARASADESRARIVELNDKLLTIMAQSEEQTAATKTEAADLAARARADAAAEAEQLRARIAEADASRASLAESLEAARAQLTTTMEAASEEVRVAESERDEALEIVADTATQLQTVTRDRDALRSRLAKLESQLADSETRRKGAESDRVDMRRKAAEAASERLKAVKGVTSRDERISALEAELLETKNRCEAFELQRDESLLAYLKMEKRYKDRIAVLMESDKISRRTGGGHVTRSVRGQDSPQRTTESSSSILSPFRIFTSSTAAGPADRPLPTAASLRNPDKAGWLQKQGGFVKAFRRRWFVLKGDSLYYFTTPTTDTPNGAIRLDGAFIQLADEHTNRSHSFGIFHPTRRTFFVAAQSRAEMSQWIEVLQAKIDLLDDMEEDEEEEEFGDDEDEDDFEVTGSAPVYAFG